MSIRYICNMGDKTEADANPDGSLPVGWRSAQVTVMPPVPAPVDPNDPVAPAPPPTPITLLQHVCPNHEPGQLPSLAFA